MNTPSNPFSKQYTSHSNADIQNNHRNEIIFPKRISCHIGTKVIVVSNKENQNNTNTAAHKIEEDKLSSDESCEFESNPKQSTLPEHFARMQKEKACSQYAPSQSFSLLGKALCPTQATSQNSMCNDNMMKLLMEEIKGIKETISNSNMNMSRALYESTQLQNKAKSMEEKHTNWLYAVDSISISSILKEIQDSKYFSMYKIMYNERYCISGIVSYKFPKTLSAFTSSFNSGSNILHSESVCFRQSLANWNSLQATIAAKFFNEKEFTVANMKQLKLIEIGKTRFTPISNYIISDATLLFSLATSSHDEKAVYDYFIHSKKIEASLKAKAEEIKQKESACLMIQSAFGYKKRKHSELEAS